MLHIVFTKKNGVMPKILKYLVNVVIQIITDIIMNWMVGITGEIDPETGYLIDLKILKDIDQGGS